MKLINYLKMAFVLAGICIYSSCNPAKYHTVTIAIDSACSAEQQTAACEVITERIASVWKVKEKTALVNGQFDITYSGEDSLLTQILAQKGEVYISETYDSGELYPAAFPVFKDMIAQMENAGIEPLWYPYGDSRDTPILICVPQQVAFVDSVFNSSKNLFPADISFCWTAKQKDEYFELLAIKSARPFPLNPVSVKNSNIKFVEREIYSRWEIHIDLNEQYGKEWARLTRDNISKSLAFVMDGKVLMYPRVNSEISGGKLSITGDFDSSEALLIKSVISGGVLDCKVRIF